MGNEKQDNQWILPTLIKECYDTKDALLKEYADILKDVWDADINDSKTEYLFPTSYLARERLAYVRQYNRQTENIVNFAKSLSKRRVLLTGKYPDHKC